jgi:hypothetical protein
VRVIIEKQNTEINDRLTARGAVPTTKILEVNHKDAEKRYLQVRPMSQMAVTKLTSTTKIPHRSA